MIIDHTRGLAEGMDDCRAAEFEAAFLESLGQRHRFWRLRGNLCPRMKAVLLRSSIKELPYEVGKTFPPLDLQVDPRGCHRSLDLDAVADDAGVVHQRRNLLSVEAGNLLGIEIGEGSAEGVALAQDRDPGKAGLEPVEDQFLGSRRNFWAFERPRRARRRSPALQLSSLY